MKGGDNYAGIQTQHIDTCQKVISSFWFLYCVSMAEVPLPYFAAVILRDLGQVTTLCVIS